MHTNVHIMLKTRVKELTSEVAELKKELRWLRDEGAKGQASLRQRITEQGADFVARIDRAGLGWAELYDKTLHYLKRIEQRDRVVEVPPVEVAPVLDEITARVNARRMKKRGT